MTGRTFGAMEGSTGGGRAAESGGATPENSPPGGTARRDRGPWIVLSAMLLYAVLHIGFRLAASWSLGEDDPVANILVQDLRAVYVPGQLPLYDWVLYAVQRVTGPTIVSFLAIKYSVLAVTGLLLYAIARQAYGAGALALLAVESLALIYQVSWRYHEGFTHQIGTMLAVTATMWAMVRTIMHGGAGNRVLLGAVAGLGLLTQPIFAAFLGALAAAVAWEPSARTRLSGPASLLAVAITALIVGTYAVVARDGLSAASLLGGPGTPSVRDALGGLVNAARAPLFYLSPLILFLPMFFTGVLQRAARDVVRVMQRPRSDRSIDRTVGDEPTMIERIVLRTSVFGFFGSLVVATALGLKGYPSHVFMPLYITSVVWLMGVVGRVRPRTSNLKLFARVAIAIAVVALLARLANMFVLDPVCRICRWGIPYGGLASAIRTDAGEAPVIVALDHELGGNLRAWLPRSRVVLSLPGSRIPRDAEFTKGRYVLVWGENVSDAIVARGFAPVLDGTDVSLTESRTVTVPWTHLWRPTGYRQSTWRILTFDRSR